MRLTILHVRDCPNVATLEDRLAEVLAGRDDVDVQRRLVDTDESARELGMTGSPTLLVDGDDPFAEPRRSSGLSCRLYRDENGQLAGAPSVDQLRRALAESPASTGIVLAGWRGRSVSPHPAGRAMHRIILQAFATTGHPPTSAELERVAADHSMASDDVLAGLHEADIIRLDADGQIAVAYPFSATPTPHRVRLASGVDVWAMCAVDALGMPDMLDTDAVITSTDPSNAQPITITVEGRNYTWEPNSAVVFLSAAAGDGPSAETCCGDLNFFTTPASAQAWIAARPLLRGEILDPAAAEHLGQRIFGPLLRANPATT